MTDSKNESVTLFKKSTENGCSVGDLENFLNLRTFLTCDLHSKTDCLIYVMETENIVFKVCPIQKELLSECGYFRLLEKNTHSFKTYQKHSALGLDFTCVYVPGVEPKHVVDFFDFLSRINELLRKKLIFFEPRIKQEIIQTKEFPFFGKADLNQLVEYLSIFDFFDVAATCSKEPGLSKRFVENMIAKKISSANIIRISIISDYLAGRCEAYVRKLEETKVILENANEDRIKRIQSLEDDLRSYRYQSI